MIWFWRALVIFTILNLINIFAVDGGAGTEIVWFAILIGSSILSIPKCYTFFFGFKWFKILVIGSIAFFCLVEAFIIGNGLMQSKEKNVDYLIVLGARVRGDVPSLELQNRLNKAIEYLEDNQETQVIVTGGQGSGENLTEAMAMAIYLEEKGISKDRIILEEKAKDTVENLTYSFEIIEQREGNLEDQEITIVTSSFHVFRAKMIANELGKKVGGLGSQTLPFLIPTYYLREFFAVVVEAII